MHCVCSKSSGAAFKASRSSSVDGREAGAPSSEEASIDGDRAASNGVTPRHQRKGDNDMERLFYLFFNIFNLSASILTLNSTSVHYMELYTNLRTC